MSPNPTHSWPHSYVCSSKLQSVWGEAEPGIHHATLSVQRFVASALETK